MFYNLVSDENGKTLTLIFSDGDTLPVSPDHPRYEEIYSAAVLENAAEDEVRALVNIVASVGERLTALSERVSVAGSTLLFDGDPVRGEIADHILRLLRDGDDKGWKALVNFLEKVQTNPNEHSRESLFSWINGRNFTITQDGDLIAYKGVQVDSEGASLSISTGTATVNGVVHKGTIPNPDGAVVEMPRSQVQHDTAVGCSTGLHAGTWDYASDFARGRVLTVKINPRDVVSVPTDCDAQKMRVSRYEVLSSVEHEYCGTTWDDYEDDEEYYGEEEEYDEDLYDEYEDEDEDSLGYDPQLGYDGDYQEDEDEEPQTNYLW